MNLTDIKYLAIALVVSLVTGCGGGGDSTPAASSIAPVENTTVISEVEYDKSTVLAAIFFHDRMAVLDTMMQIVGYTKIVGSTTASVTACPGGGSINNSTSNGKINLIANNCRPRTYDNLIYAGTWTLVIGASGNTYLPNGTCSGTCKVNGTTFNGKFGNFGYGVADIPAVNLLFDISTSQGVQTVLSTEMNLAENVGDIQIFVSGNVKRQSNNEAVSDVRVSDGKTGVNLLLVNGGVDRTPLQLLKPYAATINFSNTGIIANIDKNGDSIIDVKLDLSWNELL
jgi:hypothetical protein